MISPSDVVDVLFSGWFHLLLVMYSITLIVCTGLVVHTLFEDHAPPLPEKEEGDWFFDRFTT